MRKREILLVAGLFCMLAVGFDAKSQSINNVNFNQSVFTECDDVILNVSGQLNDLDAYVYRTSFSLSGNTIFAFLDVEIPILGNPGIMIFNEDIFVGALPAENYTVEVILRNNSTILSDSMMHLIIREGIGAGQNGTITLCDGESNFNLASALGPMHGSGGTWYDDNNTGSINTNGFLNASGLNGTYHFTYYFPGEGNCQSSEATVTVNISKSPQAGNDASIVLCSGSGQVSLFEHIGEHDNNGLWMDVQQTGALSDNGQLTVSALNPGEYYFEYSVYGFGFCPTSKAQVNVNIDVCSGMATVEREPSFSMFPNPTSGKLKVDLDVDRSKYSEMVIYNPAGKIVARYDTDQIPAGNSLSLDVSGFRPGIYIIQVSGEGETVSKKLVIQ